MIATNWHDHRWHPDDAIPKFFRKAISYHSLNLSGVLFKEHLAAILQFAQIYQFILKDEASSSRSGPWEAVREDATNTQH